MSMIITILNIIMILNAFNFIYYARYITKSKSATNKKNDITQTIRIKTTKLGQKKPRA